MGCGPEQETKIIQALQTNKRRKKHVTCNERTKMQQKRGTKVQEGTKVQMIMLMVNILRAELEMNG